MKIVIISDTHGKHHDLKLPEGDMLLHAGDVSRSGMRDQVRDFLGWFSRQPHRHKVFIAGNHDFLFEEVPASEIEAIIPTGVTYLNDSGTTIEGIRIWGSPISPWFYDWAFNRHRGADIRKHWDMIPSGTDILITHGPVYNILDTTIRGEHVGCHDLLDKVSEIKPRLHIAGHIHEAYGTMRQADTYYVNASVLDVSYKLVNAPIIINWENIGNYK